MNLKIMFYFKIFVLWAFVSGFFLVTHAHAILKPSGPEEKATVTPVFTDNGNTWRPIGQIVNTANVVLFSSSPERAVQVSTPLAIAFPGVQTDVSTNDFNAGNLGIREYRSRTIVNISSCAQLALYPASNYNIFSGTYSLVLASATVNGGTGMGGQVTLYNQGEIWGIWGNASGSCAGNGMIGWEEYYEPRKKR